MKKLQTLLTIAVLVFTLSPITLIASSSQSTQSVPLGEKMAQRYIAAIKEYVNADDKTKAAEKIDEIIRELNSLTDEDDIKAFLNAQTKAQKEDEEFVEAVDVLINDLFDGKIYIESLGYFRNAKEAFLLDDPDEDEEEEMIELIEDDEDL